MRELVGQASKSLLRVAQIDKHLLLNEQRAEQAKWRVEQRANALVQFATVHQFDSLGIGQQAVRNSAQTMRTRAEIARCRASQGSVACAHLHTTAQRVLGKLGQHSSKRLEQVSARWTNRVYSSSLLRVYGKFIDFYLSLVA